MIEALRALEKKWRSEVGDLTFPDDNYREKVEGYNACLLDCADELASILATASEQAPVADQETQA